MNRLVPPSLLALIVAVSTVWADSAAERYWPQWRGPTGNGVAPRAKPPTEWDGGRNIRWKTEIPGAGHATPIIWGDRIYLLTAIREDDTAGAESSDGEHEGRGGPRAAAQQPAPEAAPQDAEPPRQRRRPPREASTPTDTFKFAVVAVDRRSGEIVWRRTVAEEVPHEGMHTTASYASASPITDGELIYAFFGSRGLHCLDREGNVVWSQRLGRMRTRNSFGEGASPALHGDTLVVVWDHEEDDFIVAFDRKTGRELWRTPRDEPTTWTTPYIVDVNGKPQVVTAGTNKCRAYDLATGEKVWESAGLTMNVIPSPVFADGLAILTSGFRGAAIKAIRLDKARGTLADGHEAIAWTADERTPYVPSPLLVDGLVYYYDNNRPILTCRDARTGEVRFGPERVEGLESIYASPIAANGHVYLVGRSGQTTVLRQGPEPKVVAQNTLDDEFNASPVAVDGELYLRGRSTLYCIAAD